MMPFGQNAPAQAEPKDAWDEAADEIAAGTVHEEGIYSPPPVEYADSYPYDLKIPFSTSRWAGADELQMNQFALVGRDEDEDEQSRKSEPMSEALIVPTDKASEWETRETDFDGKKGTKTSASMYVVVLDPLPEPVVARIVINANREADNIVSGLRAACPPGEKGKRVVGLRTRRVTSRRGSYRVWEFCRPIELNAVSQWSKDDEQATLAKAYEALANSDYGADFVGSIGR